MEPISFATPLVSLFLAVMTLLGGGFVQPDGASITPQTVSAEAAEAERILPPHLALSVTATD